MMPASSRRLALVTAVALVVSCVPAPAPAPAPLEDAAQRRRADSLAALRADSIKRARRADSVAAVRRADSLAAARRADSIAAVIRARRAREAAWADSVLATLSLRAKVGQMFMRWIPGAIPADSARVREIRRWVTRDSLGGFIISIGTARALSAHTASLQRRSHVPLLFAADMEFGAGQRIIPEGTMFPTPMGIAATRDQRASCDHGAITAFEARAVGIHWTFSPDVDINVVPDNPIINVRSYGERATDVARYALPFIRCAQDAGLLATAKHFVGLGAANTDSHLTTSVLAFDRARLDSMELAPFRAAADSGVAAIMSAHVALPAVTGDSVPVTLNPWLARIVRDEWRYDGLLVTDAMWMRGATATRGYSPARGAVLAVRAGNDVILDPPNHRAMIDALVAAVRRGELSEARIDSSARRILRAKARAGLAGAAVEEPGATTAPMPTDSARLAEAARADSIATLVAMRSIVLARDATALVPLDFRRVRRVLVVVHLDEGRRPAAGLAPGRAFARELRRIGAAAGARVDTVVTTRATTRATLDALVARAAAADVVVLAPYVRPIPERGIIGLSPTQRRFHAAVIARQRNTIVVSFGDPYLVRQLPEVPAYVLAWNPWSPWSERAAARALAGAAPINGALPVTLGAALPRGRGIRLAAMHPELARAKRDSAADAGAGPNGESAVSEAASAVHRVLDGALSDSAFPGAYAVVGTHDRVLAEYAVGHLDWAPSPAPDAGTLWDLASLTKVVGLTSAMMQLVERGQVELDAPVQRYLPEWVGPHKDSVTVRHLLSHSSGLPSWRPLYKEAFSPAEAIALALATPLDTVPGARMVYSDLGAIIAGQIVERVSGQRLDAYLREHLFGPLGMSATTYLPDSALRDRIAPTEFDPWRQRLVRGEVHDENAFALGGISSHAGLFSTARDLARFAQMYLNRGTLDSARIFGPRTIAMFTVAQDPGLSHRALGWETPAGTTSGGSMLSPHAFGHTGFTGTSLWIDPANDLFILLLSNRVNPTRENRRITDVRAALADAVLTALGRGHPSPPPLP